ncbi:hypothetical protein FA10DRAFT_286295 [Acaromyces ingoldii]|uniref:HECT-type E3 ubiquitin transferase n=1 Tax=Acaromyces ingoldii TaxID=215250 RepID=A0A316YMW3_9BASI|nr:hypothetical protein FA10DRAFT_286295 [Acaromyces ingoldii]PWN90599.1 hypothetical protein FA10DRAFT_286295 [Acaromyces ingoldii]
MLHQVVIDVPLPTFYFAILTVRELSHYQPTLVDMGKVDQSLASGLSKLLEWDESIDGPIHETLGWNLDDEVKGTQMVVDVSNREEFVSAFIRKRLIEEPFSALQSFHGGFRAVLVGANDILRCFELFNANELVQLIRGEELPLDVTTLRRHCRVENDGDPDTVPLLLEWFWHYISSLDGPTSVLGFYRFITANHRTSILAKDEEAFHFTIFVLDERDSIVGGGPQDLPRSSTCTNTLFLPRYTSEAVLFEKFDLALTEGNNSFNLA